MQSGGKAKASYLLYRGKRSSGVTGIVAGTAVVRLHRCGPRCTADWDGWTNY